MTDHIVVENEINRETGIQDLLNSSISMSVKVEYGTTYVMLTDKHTNTFMISNTAFSHRLIK